MPLLFPLCLAAHAVLAEDPLVQPVIDGCGAALAEREGIARATLQVVDTSYSEAGTMVYLQGPQGGVWECFGYRDGAIETLTPASPEASEAAFARAADKAALAPQRITFAPGTRGARLTGALGAGGAKQFVLAARAGQTLDVHLTPARGPMYYILRSPDGSILLGGTDATVPFSGTLPSTGDYVVEVVSKLGSPQTFTLDLEID